MDNPLRKIKGRTVFRGDAVKDQNWEVALFQDLGSNPATLDASRFADFYGIAPGHGLEVADAEQAYVQADMEGPPTWVHIPPEFQPPEWKVKFPHIKDPVCRLQKALYGHPDSGTFWEKKCDRHIQKVGFKPVGSEWPSCYYHPTLKTFLVVYVDDFKMAGPLDSLPHAWKLLRQGLSIEKEARIDASGSSFLGCQLVRKQLKYPDGTSVTALTYDMSSFLSSNASRATSTSQLSKASLPS